MDLNLQLSTRTAGWQVGHGNSQSAAFTACLRMRNSRSMRLCHYRRLAAVGGQTRAHADRGTVSPQSGQTQVGPNTKRASDVTDARFCSLVATPHCCFLPPVIRSAHHVIGPVVNRRITIRITGFLRSNGRSVGSTPVEARAARIKSLAPAAPLLAGSPDHRTGDLRWNVTRASAGIQPRSRPSGRSCRAASRTGSGANRATRATAHRATNNGANQGAAHCVAHRLRRPCSGPFTLNWSVSSGSSARPDRARSA